MKYQTTNILRLANTVRQNIQIEKLINSNHLLITFSGGQDSAFCLLVLYLLNNLEEKWNCKKVLDLSDHYSKNNTLIKQSFNSNLSLSSCRHGKQSIFYLSHTKALLCVAKRSFASTSFCNQKISVTSLYRNSNDFLTPNHKLTKQSFPFSKRKVNIKKSKLISDQVTPLADNYTLLWCNHFWQKDTFFTMEHVFKLSFSKNYTMHSFAPIKKILSEQNARHWRHKVMQRLSLFLLKRNSHFVELYFNYVFITTPFLLTRSKKQNHGLCFLSNKNEFIQPSSLPEFYSLQKRNLCEDIANVKPKFVQSFDHNYLHRLIFNQNVIAKEDNTKNNFKKALLPGFDRSVTKQSCLQKQSFYNAQARVSKKLRFFYGEPTTPSLSEQLCIQGHNKSDRAEAILFNLMRGTGMNGLSTLQWKHTFFPPSNSNSKFYPIFSDFFKEIQIIHLNSLFTKIRLVSALQNKFCTKRTKAKKTLCKISSLKKGTIFRSSFNKNFFFVQPAEIVPKNKNEIIQPRKRIANSNQSRLMLFSKNSVVSTEQNYNDQLFVMQNKVVYKNRVFVTHMSSQKKFFFYYQLKYQKNI